MAKRPLMEMTDAGKIAVPLSPRQLVAARVALGLFAELRPESDMTPAVKAAEEAMHRASEQALEFAISLVEQGYSGK